MQQSLLLRSAPIVACHFVGGIRRALFRLERGVCTLCGVDCHALVRQLQQIGKDEPAWLSHRRSIIARMAPNFMERGCATYLDKLINQVGR